LKPTTAYNKSVKAFLDHKIFDSYRKNMRKYEPTPNLYFLPTTIIIEQKTDKLISLRDSIVS
jgi:hypothetical protein